MVSWRERIGYIRGGLTGTSTKDITVRQVVLHICRDDTHLTTEDIDGSLTAIQELPCIIAIAGAGPQIARQRFTITCGIVVICTAGIVTLTNRSHVTASIDITSHNTAVHGHISIAHYLTSNQAVDVGRVIVIWIFGILIGTNFKETYRIGTLTLTSTIQRVTNQTLVQCHMSVAIDIAILTAAMYRTSDARYRIVSFDIRYI